MTEAEIIQGCRKGSSRHQKLLYDQYAGLVMHLCVRYTSNYEDAQDLFQEVFVKIFVHIKTFQEGNSFAGWVRRICVNTFLNKNKAQLTQKRGGVELELSEDLPYEVIEVDFPDIPAEVLYQFIQELPIGYRTVFNMYEVEGYSHDEIADILGCSTNNSRSQLHRAKGLLKEKISEFLKQEKISVDLQQRKG